MNVRAMMPSSSGKRDLAAEDEAQLISDNFRAAKTWSILVVAIGHFLSDTPLWMLAQVALFVFAFNSSYFTAKEPVVTDLGIYWKKKIERLGPPLLVCDLFLCLVFLARGSEGILNLHTPLALVGLSGVYDWLGIRNQSAYGYGLWFLTVLWLFYLFYPLLSAAFRRHPMMSLAAAVIICLAGMQWAAQPYALWPTVFGFAYGLYCRLSPSSTGRGFPALPAAVAGFALLLGLNAFGIRTGNPYLLIALSILVTQVLLQHRLPGILQTLSRPFQDSVLEIYLIHSYLFLPRAWGTGMALVGSLALILVCARLLHELSERLGQRIKTMSFTHTSIPS